MFKRCYDGSYVSSENYLENFALLWFYCKLWPYLEYMDFIAKVGYLDFFKRIATGRNSSVFDFICVDDKGQRYVIDVKATTSSIQSVSGKIKRELARSRHHIRDALEMGFKVLGPILKLDRD